MKQLLIQFADDKSFEKLKRNKEISKMGWADYVLLIDEHYGNTKFE